MASKLDQLIDDIKDSNAEQKEILDNDLRYKPRGSKFEYCFTDSGDLKIVRDGEAVIECPKGDMLELGRFLITLCVDERKPL